MRNLFIALALLAAACTPPAPSEAPADQAASAGGESAPVNPYVAALASTPASGSWSERTDEGTTGACFGEPQSECQVVVACQMPSGEITLSSLHELSPDQDTILRVITSTQTLDLPARSFNEGLASVTATVADSAPEKIPLISVLGTPTDRFALEVGGQIQVFPWGEAVSRVLIACR